MVCRGCKRRFNPKRADAVYCTPACRQRAYRARAKQTDLEREIEATRNRYWKLVRQLEIVNPNFNTENAQFVDEDGGVWVRGSRVGQIEPHRPSSSGQAWA